MNGKKGSSNDKLGKNEMKYIHFLKEEIKNAGGSIQFQHLLGNLSQLEFDVRCAFGSNKAELMKFLKGHSDIFQINGKGNVSLSKSEDASASERNSSPTGSVELKNSLPRKINNGHGIVTKVFPAFGFMNSKEPIKTSVYFAAKDFGIDNKNLLSDFEVHTGTKLFYNAVRGLSEYEAKYRATKVWFPPNVQDENHVEQNKKTRKNRETGLYDPERKTDAGMIQKVFPSFGFIIVDNDEKNTVFFDKTHIQKYSNITDLTKILKIGDEVEYCAMRSTKKNAKARWEATQVWIKKINENALNNRLQEFDNVDMNDSRGDSFKSSRKKNAQSSLASDAGDVKTVTNRMIKNVVGKIFPHSRGIVLKFGVNLEDLVDADSSLFYSYGKEVGDVTWEFTDGDEVHFDAVRIKSAPGWKAVLVWSGERPDIVSRPCMGDFSEFDEEEIDEIETSSYTSKISGVSLLSGKSSSSKKSVENGSVHFPKKSKYSIPKLDSDSGINSYVKSRKSESSRVSNNLSDFGEFESASEKSSNILSRSTSKASVDISEESERSTERSKFSGKNKKYYKRTRRKAVDKKQEMSSYKYEPGKNWGDTPYPDEEANDVLNNVNEKEDVLSSNMTESFKFGGKYEVQDETRNLHNVMNYDNVLSHPNSEYESASEMSQDVGVETVFQTHETSEICTIADNELQHKLKPYIKTHNSIDGKIQKVFCRYALVENDCLQSPIAIFWNDFYQNGVSVEAHFDDLKEVLKPGDTVKFNCFEIVDDSGDYVQKATMAWIGLKPKLKEITPEQFIKNENLSVTITKESESDEPTVQKSVESMRLFNKTNSENLRPKKFLSVAYSNLEDEKNDLVCSTSNQSAVIENVQNSASAIQLPYVNSLDDNFGEGDLDSVTQSSDKAQLPEIICKMLQNKGLICDNSEVDLSVVSCDIINFILKYNGTKETAFENKVTCVDKGVQTVIDESSSYSKDVCKKLTHRNTPQFKETQTIITGEVIAAKVFTQ